MPDGNAVRRVRLGDGMVGFLIGEAPSASGQPSRLRDQLPAVASSSLA